MALIHNAILRGFNTIYLQAPHVKPADYADFIGYSLTWYNFVKRHHDDEEATLFPKVEELLGKKGLLDAIYEEHGLFWFFKKLLQRMNLTITDPFLPPPPPPL
jgi:hemerythrin-like domain-containing protein